MKTASMWQYGLALALAVVTVTGCGGGGGGGGGTVAPITKQTVENYPVSGVLKETDGFAMPGTVTLTATDKNGPVKLYSDKTGGQEIASVTAADDGMVSFYVAGTAVPPITIKASGTTAVPNHIASSTKFTIDKPGTTYFTINMIDMDVPSDGVSNSLVAGGLDVDDCLITPFDIQLTSTQVSIPIDTIFQDGTGAPLKGTVKASLTAFASSTATTDLIDPNIFDKTLYDPENELLPTAVLKDSDLENFPGGMNNPMVSGYFVTAGFVAVNVKDASGNQAKKLAPGGTFSIRMNIPAGTVNPITDSLLKAGDTVPIFTYDETAMVWKPEVVGGVTVEGTVLQDSNGLYVLHTTDHFSFWNLGWLVTGTGTSCTATMNLLGDAIAMPLNLKATLSSKNARKGKNVLLTGIKPAGDAIVAASNVPNQLLDIVLTDSLKNVIWSQAGVNWCAAPITASYTAPVNKKAVKVTVNVTEYCSQDPTISQVVPGTPTQVTKASTNTGRIPPIAYTPISFAVTDTAGTSIHNLVPGSYTVSAFDRRTATYVSYVSAAVPAPLNPLTVVKAVPQTISIKIPVTCKTITGATTGSTGYSF